MLIKYLGGLLWDGISALANAIACCCSSGHCCGLVENPFDLVVTLESAACSVLDGQTIAMISGGVVGDNIEWFGNLAGTADCFSTTWELNCNSSPTCSGWTLTVAGVSGCVITLSAANPDQCTCDPFELVFNTTVQELSAGGLFPCLCCAVGDAVTIRVTL